MRLSSPWCPGVKAAAQLFRKTLKPSARSGAHLAALAPNPVQLGARFQDGRTSPRGSTAFWTC